ncbi:MAG: hypothetical protein M1834_002215 [Cirrosporium novae-zelandiae]|nr:MAG: hypothetical protein M1834_002215 [Cirrosporium novae-zelandiae]
MDEKPKSFLQQFNPKHNHYARLLLYLALFLTLIIVPLILLIIFGFTLHPPKAAQINELKFAPILPPSYPLAVRSPYLSAWLPFWGSIDFTKSKAQFWAGQQLEWSVIARVNGTIYALFGDPGVGEPAVLQHAQYMTTASAFTVLAGNTTFSLTFFSPVSPHNYLRQSLPFSYLTITIESTLSPDIQVYSDIDCSWAGQHHTSKGPLACKWTSDTVNLTTHFELSLDQQITFGEVKHMARWGQAVYASRPYSSSVMSTQTGDSKAVRTQFANNGSLTGAKPSWSLDGVVAFAHDLRPSKEINGTSVTFAIGHERNSSINYLGSHRTGYYRATYPDITSAVAHFLDDYNDAYLEASKLDSVISNQAIKISNNYSDIARLSVLQVFGAIELTIPENDLNTSDVMAFVKEISSNGNIQTVDLLFSAFPIFYTMNPTFIKLLIEPTLRYLNKGHWPHKWIIHDLGTHYPNATGHNNGKAEQMPLEISGDMIMLAYAYQLASNDTGFIQPYQSVLHTAATYLSQNGWNPSFQLATTDAAGKAAHQVNLAIKSALGMIVYDKLFSDNTLRENGTALAKTLSSGLALNTNKTHFVLNYHNETSWAGIYNLYPDKLLNLDIFPDSLYTMQSNFLPTVRQEAGVPLDSRVDWTKTDWDSWIAAISTNKTRDMYINDIHAYLRNGKNDVPFADRFAVSGPKMGHHELTKCRPATGAHFALIALEGGPDVLG